MDRRMIALSPVILSKIGKDLFLRQVTISGARRTNGEATCRPTNCSMKPLLMSPHPYHLSVILTTN